MELQLQNREEMGFPNSESKMVRIRLMPFLTLRTRKLQSDQNRETRKPHKKTLIMLIQSKSQFQGGRHQDQDQKSSLRAILYSLHQGAQTSSHTKLGQDQKTKTETKIHLNSKKPKMQQVKIQDRHLGHLRRIKQKGLQDLAHETRMPFPHTARM